MPRKRKGARLIETKAGHKGKIVGEQFGKFQIELLDEELNPILDKKGQPMKMLVKVDNATTVGYID
jgi:hypothetical protein